MLRLQSLLIGISLIAICASVSAAELALNRLGNPAAVLDEVTTVFRFPAEMSSVWKTASGKNTAVNAVFGVRTGGGEVLQLDVNSVNADITSPEQNWFSLSSTVTNSDLWQRADGIGVVLGLRKGGGCWIDLTLQSDEGTFSQRIQPGNFSYPNTLEFRLLPFDCFTDKSGKRINRGRIQSLALVGAPNNNTLYLEQIFIYRKQRASPWQVDVSSDRPRTFIYEPGETVSLTFSGTDAMINDVPVAALKVQISDYSNRVIAEHIISKKITGEKGITFTTGLGVLPCGYYEARAWPMNSQGQPITTLSCIRATGSQPQGIATFAVMPRTVQENRQRSSALGENAFFGVHGPYQNLNELVGATWILDGERWKKMEPDARPDRTGGMADWGVKALSRPPMPGWICSIVNLSNNLTDCNPAWSRSGTPEMAQYYRWEDFVAFFRDLIAVKNHAYPHQKKHIYDVAWEVSLNSPAIMEHKPCYKPQDIVELYRKASSVLKEADPGAMLIGPCPNSLGHWAWLEELFRLGLGQYINGYNFHGYNAPPPEKSRMPEEIRKIRDLTARYNNGAPLAMFCTELGYRSVYGQTDRSREHAQWHVRTAIMMKGEGVKVYFPFYGIDYLQTSWGLMYNREKGCPFTTAATMPKPAALAYAVCVDQLEGMTPLSDLPWLGSDIYGYFFRSKDGITLTTWSVDNPQTISLPVGEAIASVEVVDMMGASRLLSTVNGRIELLLTPSPIYVRKLPANVFGSGIPAKQVQIMKFPGPDEKRQPGLYLLSVSDAQQQAKWLNVQSPLGITEIRPVCEDGQKSLLIVISNRGEDVIEGNLSCDSIMTGLVKQKLQLPASGTKQLKIPALHDDYSGNADMVSVTLQAEHAPVVSLRKAFNFLSAQRLGELPSRGQLPNTIAWGATGSSGRNQKDNASFTWDDQRLYVTVETDDDTHQQAQEGDMAWKEDSLQMAFDTAPDADDFYDPLAGIFTKKITGITFFLSDKGIATAWRYHTFDGQQLKSGKLDPSVVESRITRDDKTNRTLYRLAIPWREIGIDTVKTGQVVGFDILINDKDPDGARKGIELFGGIIQGDLQRNSMRFGRISLQ